MNDTTSRILAARALRRAVGLYRTGAIKPSTHEYYREDPYGQILNACPLGAVMLALEGRPPGEIPALLEYLDSEETFDEIRSNLSVDRQYAYKAAKEALENAGPHHDHELIVQSRHAEPFVNAAAVINDELLPDGEERIAAVLEWLEAAAQKLERPEP